MKKNIANVLSSFESAKPNLRVALVAERSLAVTNNAVKAKVVEDGDVYAVCKVIISEGPEGIMQATVTENLLEKWGVKKKDLCSAAMQSTVADRKPVLKTLNEMAAGMLVEVDVQADEAPKAYVLTNEQALEGAACICYPGLLDKIKKKLQCEGFYVLPSSVHEVLIIPGRWNPPDAREYREMVSSVNEAVVEPSDYLSDRPMYYDGIGLRAC